MGGVLDMLQSTTFMTQLGYSLLQLLLERYAGHLDARRRYGIMNKDACRKAACLFVIIQGAQKQVIMLVASIAFWLRVYGKRCLSV